MRLSSERLVVGAILALSLVTLALQAVVLRPRLWPAGAGVALSGDSFARLAPPAPIPVIRPPDIRDAVAGKSVTAARVVPGGPADRAGIRNGDRAERVTLNSCSFDQCPEMRVEALEIQLGQGPKTPAEALMDWRFLHDMSGFATFSGAERAIVAFDRPAIWAMQDPPWGAWFRQHLGPLSQMTAFIAGALVLVLLGARGTTATMMTLALLATATANSGPLLGAHAVVPVFGPAILIFNWLITALSFPIIGLAVLYFPHRAEILDRYKWIVPAVIAASIPMLVIGLVTALFLLGADATLPALSWLAMHGWTFGAAFAIPLAVNVLIVIEGIGRYRTNLDADERRRIQIVVYTGVPAVFAYAVKTGIPLLGGLAGRPIELPWTIEALLQAIVLLPAFGLPYAVAVRHVFSPRTVLRRGLQYAFARRTLAVLAALPVIALVASFVQQRDQSLAAIIGGRPLFYLICLVMLALAVRYRDPAQRWLDQRFFRAEYDAREILVSLAGRVPYESEPRDLVAMVVTQIDSALHPESIAVLAGEVVSSETPGGGAVMLGSFEPVSSLRATAAALRADSALVTLLRWSDKPLEVFLDDERSPVARVPPADRMWLASLKAALLVPIFAGLSRAESRGGSEPRSLVGVIALGSKQSEEPFTPEDRELLRGIAVQMGVALDLSRLRKQIVATVGPAGLSSTLTVLMGGTGTPAVGVGVVVDGKYRVDAIIGQGGMGAVFRAWDLRLERAVAIKVVRAELLSDPDARARFKRESQIVARLQHPAIVTVFDYGTLADGAAFLVMEFVPGEDLRSLLKRERKLGAGRVVALMSGISAAVESAHKSGVFHRDLKPENILLPESGIGPKVVDFGVAKLTTATGADGSLTTATGTIVGTPAYMAPEQLRGDAVDGRADVFSLGVMAYEMLSGKLPYGSGSFFEIGMKQAAGEIKVDTGDLPTGLAPVIRSAIAYERDSRPATPGDFAEDLRAAK